MSGSKLLWFEALAAFWRADLVRRIPGRIPTRVGSEQGAYAAYAANGRWNAVHAKANAGYRNQHASGGKSFGHYLARRLGIADLRHNARC